MYNFLQTRYQALHIQRDKLWNYCSLMASIFLICVLRIPFCVLFDLNTRLDLLPVSDGSLWRIITKTAADNFCALILILDPTMQLWHAMWLFSEWLLSNLEMRLESSLAPG